MPTIVVALKLVLKSALLERSDAFCQCHTYFQTQLRQRLSEVTHTVTQTVVQIHLRLAENHVFPHEINAVIRMDKLSPIPTAGAIFTHK